jgi:hypothetical protein
MIAASLVISAVSRVEAIPKLEDYSVDHRILDASVSSEGSTYRFERVHAHSRSDKVTFIVLTVTKPSGDLESFEFLVASQESGLRVRFSGWTGTRLGWKSEANWGGHKGVIDVAQPEAGIQVPLSWDI